MIKKFSSAWLLLAMASALILSCSSTKNSSGVPRCITSYINEHKSDPKWYVGSVDEFEFQGKLVYAFNPAKNVYDGATFIKSASCVDMCSVGGFAGPQNNKCNGDNFFEKSVFKRNIWKKE